MAGKRGKGSGQKAKPGDKRLGGKFWMARSSHGRNPIFESPEQLLSACYEYFEWCEANPLYETKVFHTNGIITQTDVPKMRAMTIGGLCLFLNISEITWKNYRERDKFLTVTSVVDAAIYNQKFCGAAADLFNAKIIARDLRLKDRTDVTTDDKEIKADSPLETARKLAFVLREAEEEVKE